MKTEEIIIMNFTGAYQQEHFYQGLHSKWIDCQEIQGTYGYCDEVAMRTVKEKMAAFSPYGIHFIDSGNYHYVSKFWTDKISIPFSLCLFDHHPDMKPSLFENLLSCGDWVKEALDTNPLLQKVVIIGASDQLLREIDPVYQNRLILFGEKEIHCPGAWTQFAKEYLAEPIYLSIDKDVLSPEDAKTDWDQGSLTLSELKLLLFLILQKEVVLGADICGECVPHLSALSNQNQVANDITNRDILKFLLEIKQQRQDEFL